MGDWAGIPAWEGGEALGPHPSPHTANKHKLPFSARFIFPATDIQNKQNNFNLRIIQFLIKQPQAAGWIHFNQFQ